MSEQQKILRVLKLISLLKCEHGRTIESLAELLEISKRTVYRYLDLLAAVGVDVDTTFSGNRKFIADKGDFEGYEGFTIEETALLRDLILTGTNNKPLQTSILQKLYINSELEPIADDLIDGRINLLKTKLARAIKLQKQVALLKYNSVHGGEIRDYRIEPFDFSENYTSVIALDVAQKIVKQFKLSRIGEALMLDKDQEFMDLHQFKGTDVFNFSGENPFPVKLKLSFQAYILLREEYPKSLPYLVTGEQGEHFFIGKANHLHGVGRFVLGMLDEIVVIEPQQLKDYIREKLNAYQKLDDARKLSDDKAPGFDRNIKLPAEA